MMGEKREKHEQHEKHESWYPHQLVLLVLLVPLVLLSCDSPQGSAEASPPPSITVRPVESAGGSFVLSLDSPVSSTVVGSFRFAIHFDTTALRFLRVDGGDTMSVAANALGDRVLVAGASAAGFGDGGWLALVFEQTSERAAATPRVELLELTDLRGGDLRPKVRADPPYARLPGGRAP